LAEFSEASNLISAAAAIRDAGYKRWDCYSPFPVHGMDRVMRLKPTVLPWMVFAGGFAGATGALALAWFCNAYAYPLIFSGKPYWSLPANIPVAFPLTILLASITTFFGLWALTGLPRPHHPLFTSERFRRVTDDGFFIAIEATDPCYHTATTTELLRRLGAIAVEEIKD
jgi:hypothetical protein